MTRSWAVRAVCRLFPVLLGVATAGAQDERDPLAEARRAEAAGHYQLAAQWYGKAIEANPTRQALLDRARVLSWSRSFDAALADYRSLLGRDPSDVDARLGEAQLLSWTNHLDEALHAYERLLADAPALKELYFKIAEVESWRRRLHAAETWYTRSLEVTDAPADTYARLGEVSYWFGYPRRARRFYDRALQERPGHPEALEGLADLRKLEEELVIESEYVAIPEQEDWQRMEASFFSYLRSNLEIGVTASGHRRFGQRDASILGWVAFPLPRDVRLRAGAGFSSRGRFLPDQRYFLEASMPLYRLGLELGAAAEYSVFGSDKLVYFTPLRIRVRRFNPLELRSDISFGWVRRGTVDGGKDSELTSFYVEASYPLTGRLRTYVGGYRGVDTRSGRTSRELESDSIVGGFVGTILDLNDWLGLKTEIHALSRNGPTDLREPDKPPRRLEMKLILRF